MNEFAQKNREKFISLCEKYIHLIELNSFIDYLEQETDFFTAPASTKYHGAYEGGLCEHSIAVFEEALCINSVYFHPSVSLESLAICCLFHDVCKVNTYTTYYKNVKDEATGKWYRQEAYQFDDQDRLGMHGTKSAYIVMSHLDISQEEFFAIAHHMGAWDNSPYNKPGDFYSVSRLGWIVHVADEAATYVRGI